MCCSVNVSVFLVCCVFERVNCFTKCLGVVAILLLKVLMCLVWVEEVLYWIDRVWSSRECACCVCDPSVHQSVPSICFVCVFVCRKLSPYLRV